MNSRIIKAINRFAATGQEFRDEIRRQTSIYQYGMKRSAAAFNGVPPDTYDNMKYADWETVRTAYLSAYYQTCK